MGITVAVLTYNEEENIKDLIPQIIENIETITNDYEILVIDSDKSTDNSKRVCEQYSVNYIVQEEPFFIGAFKTAIKYAQKEIFLYIDADFSHPPEYIPQLYNAFIQNNADLVIGSRYVKGGISDDYPKNILYSKILNIACSIVFGIPKIKDLSAGYKMYKTSVLKNMNFISRYFEMQMEIYIKARLQNPNFKVIEIPIHFKKRSKGCSKRNYLTFLPRFCSTLVILFFYQIFYKLKIIKK